MSKVGYVTWNLCFCADWFWPDFYSVIAVWCCLKVLSWAWKYSAGHVSEGTLNTWRYSADHVLAGTRNIWRYFAGHVPTGTQDTCRYSAHTQLWSGPEPTFETKFIKTRIHLTQDWPGASPAMVNSLLNRQESGSSRSFQMETGKQSRQHPQEMPFSLLQLESEIPTKVSCLRTWCWLALQGGGRN